MYGQHLAKQNQSVCLGVRSCPPPPACEEVGARWGGETSEIKIKTRQRTSCVTGGVTKKKNGSGRRYLKLVPWRKAAYTISARTVFVHPIGGHVDSIPGR